MKAVTPTKRHTKLNKFQLKNYLPEGLSKDEAQHLLDRAEEYSDQVRKSLSKSKIYQAGRNNRGVITTRHKGGQVKRRFRDIDFNRDKHGVPAEVVSVEYDPNRSAHIALLKYDDGEFRYILAPDKITLGSRIVSQEELESITAGNAYPLKSIPPATMIHAVELTPGEGAVLARSAGTALVLQGKAGNGYVQVKMPSGEIRLVHEDCYATIGFVSNDEHTNQKYGKAGRMRRKGRRPSVRGVAQSYKHPHGGGQGKSGRHGPGGPAKDPWGNKRGKITRKNKSTNKFIIKRRTSKLRPKNKPYKTLA